MFRIDLGILRDSELRSVFKLWGWYSFDALIVSAHNIYTHHSPSTFIQFGDRRHFLNYFGILNGFQFQRGTNIPTPMMSWVSTDSIALNDPINNFPKNAHEIFVPADWGNKCLDLIERGITRIDHAIDNGKHTLTGIRSNGQPSMRLRQRLVRLLPC